MSKCLSLERNIDITGSAISIFSLSAAHSLPLPIIFSSRFHPGGETPSQFQHAGWQRADRSAPAQSAEHGAMTEERPNHLHEPLSEVHR
jgi:hypothetical protein